MKNERIAAVPGKLLPHPSRHSTGGDSVLGRILAIALLVLYVAHGAHIMAYAETMTDANAISLGDSPTPVTPRRDASLFGSAFSPLVMVPSIVAFDSVRCGTTRCTTIVIRNDADSTVQVHRIDGVSSAFTLDLATPVIFQPREVRQVTLCYSPPVASTRDSIEVLLVTSAGAVRCTVTGRGIAANVQLTASEINIDSSRVGSSSCRTLRMLNAGDAAAVITTRTSAPEIRVLATGFSIPAGGMFDLDICVRPVVHGRRNGFVEIEYEACAGTPVRRTIPVRTDAWDEIIVLLPDTIRVRPGSELQLPIRFGHPVPVTWGVDTVAFTLEYEKFMIAAPGAIEGVTECIRTEGSGAAAFPRRYAREWNAGSTSELDISFAGSTYMQATSDTKPFVTLALSALLGPKRFTTVRSRHAYLGSRFLVLRSQASTVIHLDSLPDLDARLLDARERNTISARVAPHPVTGPAMLELTLRRDDHICVRLYDAIGRYRVTVYDAFCAAGVSSVRLDPAGLPPGAYFLRISSASGTMAVQRVEMAGGGR